MIKKYKDFFKTNEIDFNLNNTDYEIFNIEDIYNDLNVKGIFYKFICLI
jgi:hypothetical protein